MKTIIGTFKFSMYMILVSILGACVRRNWFDDVQFEHIERGTGINDFFNSEVG